MKKFLFTALAAALSLNVVAQELRTLDLVEPEYREGAKAWLVDFSTEKDRANFTANAKLLAQKSAQPAEHWVAPAENDQPQVDLYVYKPQNAQGKLPVIYFTHGGGYVLGNAKMDGDNLQAIADKHQAAVVSVEYRLATVAPFPADVNDAYHGLRYVYQNGEKLGLNTQKLVLMGESAGGGLAARLALFTRDKGEFAPEGQVLIYPMLDYRTGTDKSPYHNEFAGEFVWTAAANRFGWNTLRGGQNIAENQMPYFSAATATDLSNLPPTFMMTGDLDLFVNEDMAYANRLIQAGVPTDFQLISGVYHAFEHINPNAEPSKRYVAERSKAIEKMFAKPRTAKGER